LLEGSADRDAAAEYAPRVAAGHSEEFTVLSVENLWKNRA
jgi:hypothetical protein